MLNDGRASRTIEKPASCTPVNEHIPVPICETLKHLIRAVLLVSQFGCKVVQVYQGTTLLLQSRTRPGILSSFYQRDPTSHDPMDFNSNICCATRATRVDLTADISDLEHNVNSDTPDVGAK